MRNKFSLESQGAPASDRTARAVFATTLAFVRLSRPKFLIGGLIGGALGTALANHVAGRFDPRAYALAQLTITAFHLMTHYANDYFDRACDARSVRTPYSGGSGALVDGSLHPRVALRAALGCAGLGAIGVAALGLLAHAGIAAAVGASIGALAWAYSAPPLRLLARGLGELDTAVIVAILVPLCAYAAQRPPLVVLALASTLPGAAAMFAMMLAVEFPDLASDTVGGKRNLVVRFGPARARSFALAAVVATYGAVAIALACGAPPALAFLELLSLPAAVGLGRALRSRATGRGVADEVLAGRGVAFFVVVTFDALLAYAVAGRG